MLLSITIAKINVINPTILGDNDLNSIIQELFTLKYIRTVTIPIFLSNFPTSNESAKRSQSTRFHMTIRFHILVLTTL